MNKQEEEFKKAVKKEFNSNLACAIFTGFSAYLFIWQSFSFELDGSLSLVIFMLGSIFAGISVGSIMQMIRFKSNTKLEEEYVLCKRCKCLIKKDKIFCDHCKDRLRGLNKYEEDKKLLGDYKNLVEQEEKKKDE